MEISRSYCRNKLILTFDRLLLLPMTNLLAVNLIISLFNNFVVFHKVKMTSSSFVSVFPIPRFCFHFLHYSLPLEICPTVCSLHFQRFIHFLSGPKSILNFYLLTIMCKHVSLISTFPSPDYHFCLVSLIDFLLVIILFTC